MLINLRSGPRSPTHQLQLHVTHPSRSAAETIGYNRLAVSFSSLRQVSRDKPAVHLLIRPSTMDLARAPEITVRERR